MYLQHGFVNDGNARTHTHNQQGTVDEGPTKPAHEPSGRSIRMRFPMPCCHVRDDTRGTVAKVSASVIKLGSQYIPTGISLPCVYSVPCVLHLQWQAVARPVAGLSPAVSLPSVFEWLSGTSPCELGSTRANNPAPTLVSNHVQDGGSLVLERICTTPHTLLGRRPSC